jgi:hypothetical protein
MDTHIRQKNGEFLAKMKLYRFNNEGRNTPCYALRHVGPNRTRVRGHFVAAMQYAANHRSGYRNMCQMRQLMGKIWVPYS